MAKTPLTDELLRPETREELQRRLKKPQGRADWEFSPANSPSRGATVRRSSKPANARVTREDIQAMIEQTRSDETFPIGKAHAGAWSKPIPDSLRKCWQNPKFRKRCGMGLAAGAAVLILMLLIAGSADVANSEEPAVQESAKSEIDSSPKSPRLTKNETAAESRPIASLEKDSEANGLPRQELSPLVPEPIPSADPKPRTVPIQVLSFPPGAEIVSQGEPTGYKTPALLDPHFSTDSLSVRLGGYRIRQVDSERRDGVELRKFYLEPIPDNPLLIPSDSSSGDEYGFDLSEAQQRSLASAVEKLLHSDWGASAKTGVAHAESHRAAWAPFAKWDPRLEHAYGLVLWHHGEIHKAKLALAAAVKREQARPGRRVPYYPLYRDKIRLQSVTNEEAVAAEDLLDLARDTARTLENHPHAGMNEALKNADFAGRLVGFLEGPSRARLAQEVNLRLLAWRIEESFPNSELQETYKSARSEVGAQYQQELAQVEVQQRARNEKQRALQESGRLGRTHIRSRDHRNTGKHARSDYNTHRIPYVSRVFINDRGEFAFSTGPAAFYFWNPLYTSGPSISKSFFNNRTVNTTRDTRKVVLEKLPAISWRRPQSLTTYLPQELERKRREILESVSGEAAFEE